MFSTSLMSLAITYLGCVCGFEKKIQNSIIETLFFGGVGEV